MSKEHLGNGDMVQLPLQGFLEPVKPIGVKLRLIGYGKLIWDTIRHPNSSSIIVMDPIDDEVRSVHWNNSRELVEYLEKQRTYIPL